ncbi:UDP-N-acetylmuramoyl-tripeptide--D-alanyl-D-alanine ligase [Geofilum rubicundum]|uniref:UDP-N-acetylmuramoyl-tripeptide--D-alanyl-D-alanine ligase n=1 Tax=Geofilum rubicundum JCM 15548 TaxID=1236989 RepID=A0A0E9LTJ5_9BACT|nr:UDP-N-acetylmuramoyl-tripeptide--D-alanyl-D-alanine ligase [Geofilum rubicundum]GAO28185.1 UDP-N-acetylmuramoylalanyl-D-glutamyl-2,6-diaminopimelate-D-alanyl-D-alanine ligase [Geofilum rubicundum JCM 15548]
MEQIYQQYLLSRKVTTDSRNCPPGSIYFSLKGERFDGNEFALEALSKGCEMAVVDDVRLKNEKGCIWVSDALEALQSLARHHRQASGVKVIGITGSNGKTTTKELMAQVLSRKYKVWFTQGNLNNHIGVPLTLLSMPEATEMVVLEMGANHQGEIARLCEIGRPDFGLITNVGKAHIEGFGSFEGIKIGKGELYRFLKREGRPVFINRENAHLKEMLGTGFEDAFQYGTGDACDVKGSGARVNPFLSFFWQRKGVSEPFEQQTQLTGIYNLENALAAIAVGIFFGVSDADIHAAIAAYQPANQRSQVVKTGTNKIIMDAYNANPSSMAVALENFRSIPAEKRVVVLGGMKELGIESSAEHQILMDQLKAMAPDLAFLVGPEFKELVPKTKGYFWFESGEALIRHLTSHPVENALVLVKGSRANQLEKALSVL